MTLTAAMNPWLRDNAQRRRTTVGKLFATYRIKRGHRHYEFEVVG